MPLDVYKDWLGIPEGPRPPGHYELLRLVQFEDNFEKIRKNYSKLNNHVRKYASGKYLKESQDLMNEMAKAMLCLTDPERKLEYDESLGRVVESGLDKEKGANTILHILYRQKKISKEQAKEAKQFADARGISLRDGLVQMKIVDQGTATEAWAGELGYSYVDLETMTPDESVLDQIPRTIVKRHSILPLFIDDDMLLTATVHEPSPELEDEIRLRMGIPMRPVLASPRAINQGIAKYYAAGMRNEEAIQEPESKKDSKPKKTRTSFSDLSKEEQKQKKQIAMVVFCWSIIGSAIIDFNFITDFTAKFWPIQFFLTLFIPPVVGVYLLKSYLK